MNFNSTIFSNLFQTSKQEHTHISIFIPTYKTGNVQEDKIRFKNALSEASNQLLQAPPKLPIAYNERMVRRLLRPAEALLNQDNFWSHLSEGLAVFITEERFEYYILPIDFNPLVYVDTTFYLRPLSTLLHQDDRFFILALSQNKVRFFEGGAHHISPVKIKDLVPESMEEVLYETASNLQYHSAGGTNIYHGQGGRKEQKNRDLEKYFRQIDDGLMEMLHDEEAPLIIAAVDYLVPIYKKRSKYNHISDKHISGNPDLIDPVLLHEMAVNALAPVFKSLQSKQKTNFNSFLNEGMASTKLSEIVLAAHGGRIETLFINKDTSPIWGKHMPRKARVEIVDASQKALHYCLLNYAALHTWKNGGNVFNVLQEQMPESLAPMNAMYRF